MADPDPKSQSPSGAEPHNSYGLVSDQTTSKSNDNNNTASEAQSQSPSGAEPHNSYGLAPNPAKSGTSNKNIADDPTYNQPKPESSSDKSIDGKEEGAVADDPTYNQPVPSPGGGAARKPADSRSKL